MASTAVRQTGTIVAMNGQHPAQDAADGTRTIDEELHTSSPAENGPVVTP
jgi:hypothetical protein